MILPNYSAILEENYEMSCVSEKKYLAINLGKPTFLAEHQILLSTFIKARRAIFILQFLLKEYNEKDSIKIYTNSN